MIRHTLIAGLMAFGGIAAAQAQTQAPAVTPSSPAKKELVAKVIALQQPGIEGVARQLVEVPAMQMLQAAGAAMQQRVAPDRRQAVATDIQADVRKYADEMNPVVRERAMKMAPGVIAPMLEERFSEDELRQLITIIESPVNRKYQAMGPELQKALLAKLGPEVRTPLETKLKALNDTVAKRIGPAASAPAGK